jgi:hypothetical protein
MKRFQIRVDPIWRPAVLIGGATRNNSYVDVDDEAITFHFGFLFNHTEDRDDITNIRKRNWPWWMGIGWRTNMRGLVGLTGSYNGVVEISFVGETPAWGFFKLNRIAVSLEDPDGFIAALNEPRVSPVEKEPAAKKPASRRGNGRKATRARRTSPRHKASDA